MFPVQPFSAALRFGMKVGSTGEVGAGEFRPWKRYDAGLFPITLEQVLRIHCNPACGRGRSRRRTGLALLQIATAEVAFGHLLAQRGQTAARRRESPICSSGNPHSGLEPPTRFMSRATGVAVGGRLLSMVLPIAHVPYSDGRPRCRRCLWCRAASVRFPRRVPPI